MSRRRITTSAKAAQVMDTAARCSAAKAEIKPPAQSHRSQSLRRPKYRASFRPDDTDDGGQPHKGQPRPPVSGLGGNELKGATFPMIGGGGRTVTSASTSPSASSAVRRADGTPEGQSGCSHSGEDGLINGMMPRSSEASRCAPPTQHLAEANREAYRRRGGRGVASRLGSRAGHTATLLNNAAGYRCATRRRALMRRRRGQHAVYRRFQFRFATMLFVTCESPADTFR